MCLQTGRKNRTHGQRGGAKNAFRTDVRQHLQHCLLRGLHCACESCVERASVHWCLKQQAVGWKLERSSSTHGVGIVGTVGVKSAREGKGGLEAQQSSGLTRDSVPCTMTVGSPRDTRWRPFLASTARTLSDRSVGWTTTVHAPMFE